MTPLTPEQARQQLDAHLREIITWHFYASAIIVFIGLYLFYRHELQVTGIEKHHEKPQAS